MPVITTRKDVWGAVWESPGKGWRAEPPLLRRAENGSGDPARREAYRKGGGCQQRQRSQDPLQSGFYDLPHYRAWIEEAIGYLPADPIVADIGCGDGRGVEVLLESGVGQIIAQDFNDQDLRDLWESLPADLRPSVLPVCSSVTDPPLLPGQADAVLMTEVANVLPDPQEAYHSCRRWLKDGGYALVSNVAVGAYFVHALLNGAWDQISQIADLGSYTDTVSGWEVPVSLYTEERMREDAENSGFERVWSQTISGAPGLLLHALRSSGELTDERIQLVASVAEASVSIPRLYVDLLRKPD